MYELLTENKELIKFLYALIVVLICATIVLKSDRLFRLSSHKGIRYFRNAFFFYGIAFFVRYFIGTSVVYSYLEHYLIRAIFEYFLVMAGFFLLYSLLWKKIEGETSVYSSSLFNSKIAVFHLMTLIIVLLDYIWGTYFFMALSQILLFSYASIISYINYRKNGKKHNFLKFYFVAMLLSLLAWILNSLAAFYLEWNQGVLANVYLINILIFFLFLYGVIMVTK